MNFCSYFDYGYIVKALICYETLKKHCSNLCFYVLCFDERTENLMNGLDNVVTIKLDDVEKYYPELLEAKKTRQDREYYATMSPILPLYIFDKYGVDLLYYTDADIGYFSSTKEIEDVFSNYSIMVTPHENPDAFSAGKINVGVLGYRNDDNCKEFLNWWKEKCLENCDWKVSKHGFADQGYLDIFYNDSNKFKNYFISDHCGINLAPWNVGMHSFKKKANVFTVDNKNLICYHFHRFDERNGRQLENTVWHIPTEVMNEVYMEYFELMMFIKGRYNL